MSEEARKLIEDVANGAASPRSAIQSRYIEDDKDDDKKDASDDAAEVFAQMLIDMDDERMAEGKFVSDADTLTEQPKKKKKKKAKAGGSAPKLFQKRKAKFKPPPDLNKKSAPQIAKAIAKGAKSLKQASDRLNFFINRWGVRMPDEIFDKLSNVQLFQLPKLFKKKK